MMADCAFDSELMILMAVGNEVSALPKVIPFFFSSSSSFLTFLRHCLKLGSFGRPYGNNIP